jgi:prepilin-type N-terminal cleavage/methylation domain-containing protein/prepilin-type processing-associated H-X9-DG protein
LSFASAGSGFRARAVTRAFTLVELLVVIGIIAVLIAILLPLLNKSRESGLTLKCQAQLRQMYNGLSIYAIDNQGRLPWGQFESDLATKNFITWQTVVNHEFNSRAAITLNREPGSNEMLIGESPTGNIFLCPAAPLTQTKSTYACNIIAMPDKDYETANTNVTKQSLLQPAQLSKLYPRNILLFDTGAVVNSDAMYVVGYDVDDQLYANPGDTDARFFSSDDPYATNPYRGNGLPIITDPNQNKDWIDTGVSAHYPWQGNVRYRHNGNRLTNAIFADGHVESLAPTQIIRTMWKLRWPTGMPASIGSWTQPGG